MTGPPGAGKSTLTTKLTQAYRADGKRVGLWKGLGEAFPPVADPSAMPVIVPPPALPLGAQPHA